MAAAPQKGVGYSQSNCWFSDWGMLLMGLLLLGQEWAVASLTGVGWSWAAAPWMGVSCSCSFCSLDRCELHVAPAPWTVACCSHGCCSSDGAGHMRLLLLTTGVSCFSSDGTGHVRLPLLGQGGLLIDPVILRQGWAAHVVAVHVIVVPWLKHWDSQSRMYFRTHKSLHPGWLES